MAASRIPVKYIGLDGQELPLGDGSVDHVLTTWTLCTIADVGERWPRSIGYSGGEEPCNFLEHGRSPDPKGARRQDRFTLSSDGSLVAVIATGPSMTS